MFNGLTEGIPGLTAHATKVTVTVTAGATRSSGMSRSPIQVRSTPSSRRCSARARCRFRALAGERAGAAQYRFLRPSGQLAVDGSAVDAGRHHQNAKPDYAGRDGRLRLCLSSRVYQRKHRHEGQPLRRRDRADFERPAGVDIEGNAYCTTAHGGQIDNYKLARNNKITLRMDELNTGVSTCSRPPRRPRSRPSLRPRRSIDFRSIRWIACGRSASSSWSP